MLPRAGVLEEGGGLGMSVVDENVVVVGVGDNEEGRWRVLREALA